MSHKKLLTMQCFVYKDLTTTIIAPAATKMLSRKYDAQLKKIEHYNMFIFTMFVTPINFSFKAYGQ